MRPFICEITDSAGKTRHLDVMADSRDQAIEIAEANLEPGARVTDVFDEAAEDSDPRIPLNAETNIRLSKLLHAAGLTHGGKIR